MSETVPLWFEEIRFHLAEHVGPGGWVEAEPTGAATVSSRVDPGVMVGDRIPIGIISGRSSKTTARVADVRPPGDNKSGRYEVDVDDIITEEVSMSERPTPEQIIDRWDYDSNQGLMLELREHGYVIVHPDDVPSGQAGIRDVLPPDDATQRIIGWNACRDHIFGGDHE